MRRRLAFILFLALAAPPATAQHAPPITLGQLDASRLVPGTWTYDVVVRVDGEEHKIGTRALSIDRASRNGRPAWLVVETSWSTGTSVVDSLFLDAASLRPLHRSLQLGPARLVAEFSGDSARGTIRSSSGEAPFATALSADAVVNAGMLEVILRLAPLRAGWRGRANLVVVGSAGRSHSAPTDLAVSGEETVTVPAGTFAAWVGTSSSADGREQRLWLSREGQWVLRSTASVPQMPGAVVETVLVGHATAPR